MAALILVNKRDQGPFSDLGTKRHCMARVNIKPISPHSKAQTTAKPKQFLSGGVFGVQALALVKGCDDHLTACMPAH